MALDARTREIITLMNRLSAGNYPAGIHDRFVELTGMSIGEARYNAQFKKIVLFTIEDGKAGTVINLSDREYGDVDKVFKRQVEENGELSIELWGQGWPWDEGLHLVSCLHSHNRPEGLNVAEIAASVFNRGETYELNAYQKAAARVYGQGDYSYLLEETFPNYQAFKDALENISDTMFHFIMIELADSEDVENLEEAIRRMDATIEDVQTVISALQEIDEAPAPGR